MVSFALHHGNSVASLSSLSLSSTTSSSSSMAESLERTDAPPDYDPLLSTSTIRKKYNIQPREDEGNEILPPYSSAISLCNVFLHKKELESAVHRATDRTWIKVAVGLQGTALTLYKYKASVLSGWNKDAADMPEVAKMGTQWKSYNLQHADVGIAADYNKKKYVIRVRAETDQFLLSCTRIETFVIWLQSLFAAIDLAPPLDDRQIPRDLSIPRPRRRSREGCVRYRGNIRDAELVTDQVRLMQRHYPQLVATVTSPDQHVSRPASQLHDLADEAADRLTEAGLSPGSSARPSIAPSQASSHTSSFSFSHLSASTVETRPSIDETGKWRPSHQWTAMYDMMYAKRCMAVLTHRSPRKTNYVILKGKQWVIDWATGKLSDADCYPPAYGTL